jgi:hypothetical protein
MDPNETLRRLRELCAKNQDLVDPSDLVELVEALDSWVSKGGFLPKAWERPAAAQEQLFEVRLLTEDNQALTVGRYYSYASALAHAKRTKERHDSLSRIDCTDVVVVPVVVLP